MIINGYCIQKDINGNNYIVFINPDNQGETEWTKFWFNLIIAIKNIIPQANDLLYDRNEEFGFCIEREHFRSIYCGISVDTLYGKINIENNFTDEVTITANDNNELINTISILLGKSAIFSKVHNETALK